MYKCDLCYHRLKDGRRPACIVACPQKAMAVGSKKEMKEMALTKAHEIGGYTYGINENGGTSTFYVSPVPFKKIHQVLMEQKSKQPNPDTPGFPGMPIDAGNILDTANGMIGGVLIAPVAGAMAAGYAAYRTMKGGDEGGK